MYTNVLAVNVCFGCERIWANFSCQSVALKLLLVCLHCGKQLLAVSLWRLCRLSCFEWDILGPIHVKENRNKQLKTHIIYKNQQKFLCVSLARCCQGHVFFPGCGCCCGWRNGPVDRETCRGALGHAAGKSDMNFPHWSTSKAILKPFFCRSQSSVKFCADWLKEHITSQIKS